MTPHAAAFSLLFTAFSALLAFWVLWRTSELMKLSNEPKWRHYMSGEHTGPGGPDASGSEHLHHPGGLWDPERRLLSDHKDIKGRHLPSQSTFQLRRDNIFILEVTRHQNTRHDNPCYSNSKWLKSLNSLLKRLKLLYTLMKMKEAISVFML